MKVENFMTAPVVTVQPNSSIRDAARPMVERKISGLPVVDAGDHVVGIGTERDLLHRRADGDPKPAHSQRIPIDTAHHSEIIPPTVPR
jgi:predicted transcriptional regulator